MRQKKKNQLFLQTASLMIHRDNWYNDGVSVLYIFTDMTILYWYIYNE